MVDPQQPAGTTSVLIGSPIPKEALLRVAGMDCAEYFLVNLLDVNTVQLWCVSYSSCWFPDTCLAAAKVFASLTMSLWVTSFSRTLQ